MISYLTAMRVRSSKGEEGVNCFFHESSASPIREGGIIVLPRTLELVRDQPVRASVTVAGSGNVVRSYLDIVSDGPDPSSVFPNGISELIAALMAGAPPIRIERQSFAIEFNTELGMTDAAVDEVHHLASSLRALLEGGSAVWTPDRAPLVVEIAANPDGDTISMRLSSESERRLRAERPRWHPATVRIEDGVLADFLETIPDSWSQLALMVTGLNEAGLLAAGGVRFELVRPSGRETLLEWPERAVA